MAKKKAKGKGPRRKGKIFGIEVTKGKEKKVLKGLVTRAKRAKVPVYALFSSKKLKGLILVEAKDRRAIPPLIRGVDGANKVADGKLDRTVRSTYEGLGGSLRNIELKKGDVLEVIPSRKRTRKKVKTGFDWKAGKMALLKFFGPFLLFGAVIGTLFLFLPRDTVLRIFGFMVLYFIPPAGKETIIPAAVIALDMNFVLVALAIAFVDIVTALFLVWNFDLAMKVPFLGPWIKKFEKSNANVLQEKRWFGRLAILGIVMFVIVPFQGSGGVGASILGRIVGLKPWTVFTGISAGTIIGTLMIGYISETLGERIFNSLDTVEAKVVGAIVLITAIVIFSLRMWRHKIKLGPWPTFGAEEE